LSYTDGLNTEQKKNIGFLKAEMLAQGITNNYSQAGILAIISKESSFMPKRENMSYSAKRIREVWPSTTVSESESLAGNPEALANAKYSNRYDTPAGKGYAYRGGGFNQLTFKSSYCKYGKITGTDLCNKPELIEDPKTAAKVAVGFAKNRIESLKKNGKLKSYNASDINDFKNLKDATQAFYHANTGAGKSVSYVKGLEHSDRLGGMKKALDRVSDLHNYVSSLAIKTFKKRPVTTILITTLILISGYVLITQLIKTK
tara:strand:+ start:37 stop:813 length:777 start_codon:yes stop_codon:yes gene_type:complete